VRRSDAEDGKMQWSRNQFSKRKGYVDACWGHLKITSRQQMGLHCERDADGNIEGTKRG
jgi:hypothetical protein